MECLLASMDGMTNAPFRSLCFEYGADGATTEMIAARGFARAKHRLAAVTAALFIRRPEEKRLAAQILGNEPRIMAQAAKRIEDLGRFDAVEINMGCPARVVIGSECGAYLLKDPGRAGEIVRAVCEATSLPVRLKLRLGWDAERFTAPEITCAAQQAGCRSIILHGRTREQGYGGAADVERMREVAGALDIPVYANGGVTCAEDAADFCKAAGAAGVAVGRAALKAPWIFEDIRALEKGEAPRERDAEERIGLLLRFVERLCLQKPEGFAVPEMRKFVKWYCDGLSGADGLFERIKTVDSLSLFKATLDNYLDGLICRNDTHIHEELRTEQSLNTVRRQERKPVPCGLAGGTGL